MTDAVARTAVMKSITSGHQGRFNNCPYDYAWV